MPWFVLLQVSSAPAAVNPSIWDFVGMELGKHWDTIGTTPVITYAQSQVDHLLNFQIEVDQGNFLKIQVDQESKKIQTDHRF